jgi:folylpolyglutamate synthase/dihydropteroate synthase
VREGWWTAAARAHLGGAELVVDVAHNEPAVGALLSAAAALLPAAAPRVLIFGANSDKDVAKMLAMVSATPHLVGAVAVCSGHPKAMKAEEISPLANGGGGGGPAWTAAATMEEALTQAAAALRQAADAADPPPQKRMGTVLCFGSVFVAAAMREALAKLEPALFQEDDWVFEGAKEPPLVM